MKKLDHDFLQDVGLGGLPQEESDSLLLMLKERLELHVGKRLTDQMSEAQLKEFETLMPIPEDSHNEQVRKEQAAYSWLEKNFPHYKQIVSEEMDKLESEVKRDASTIRNSIQADNPAQDVSNPPQV